DSLTRLNIVVKSLMLPRECYAPVSGVTGYTLGDRGI
ncbi:hypothetical protein PENNAL_c0189G08696, partial [Penicillium nalgiovense]